MTPARVAVVLLLLAGCLGPQRAEPPGPDDLPAIASAALALPATVEGVQVVYDVVRTGNATLAFAGTTWGPPVTGWACGVISIATFRNGTFSPAFGRSLAFSNGHALMVAHGGSPFVANYTYASDRVGAHLEERFKVPFLLRGGQQVILQAAYRQAPEGANLPLRATLNLTTEGTLRLNRTVPFAFQCGANLEGFQGTFAAQGIGASPVVVQEALAEHDSPHPSRAEFFVIPAGGLPSVCEASILHDGAVVATTGRQAHPSGEADCLLGEDVAPGRVGFHLRDSVMPGPLLLYTLRSRPPGLLFPGSTGTPP